MTEHLHSYPNTDIAIIGAGIAGTYCASLLSKAGKKVYVVEKSRGTGGRSSSKGLSSTESCDLGAPFFHISNPSLQSSIEQWQESNVLAPWKEANKDSALAYVGIPKMSALTRFLIQDSTLINNCRVHHIERSNNQWLLRDESYNAIISCNTLIITTPASQASSLLATQYLLNDLLQDAHKASALCKPQWSLLITSEQDQITHSAGLNKVLIEPDDNNVVERIILDSMKPNRSSNSHNWVIQARSDWSETHLDTSKEVVMHALSKAFFEITGLKGTPLVCHRWLLGKHTPITGAPSRWNNIHVGLAADWLCQGNVEGALLSAQHLCNTILTEDKSQ